MLSIPIDLESHLAQCAYYYKKGIEFFEIM